VERAWKALQAGAMYDAIRFCTEAYRNELARRVGQLGYKIRSAKYGFEIVGVSDELLRRFSKRSAQRDEVVREMTERLGRSLTTNEISRAVHQSRPKKIGHLSAADVRARQWAELAAIERESLTNLVSSANKPAVAENSVSSKAAVDFATAHVFERKSVATEH